jgi:hypothetical protein
MALQVGERFDVSQEERQPTWESVWWRKGARRMPATAGTAI